MLRNISVLLLTTFIGGAASAAGAELKLFGSITGQVRNTAGTTQMGATVFLMNRHERVVQRALTSPDGRFTVIEVECLGACGFATPVMVNEEFIESMTPDKVPELLARLP